MPELPSSVPKMLAVLARMDLPNWELNMRLAAVRGDTKAKEWLDIVTQASRHCQKSEHGHDRDRDREEREHGHGLGRGRRLQKGLRMAHGEEDRDRDREEREHGHGVDRGRRLQKGLSMAHGEEDRDRERRIPSRSRSRSFISQTIRDRRREDPVPRQEDPAFGLVLGPIPEPDDSSYSEGYDQEMAWCRIKDCNKSMWPVNLKGAWTFCKAHKQIVTNLPQEHPLTRQLLLESST